MDKYTETLLYLDSDKINLKELVSILVLIEKRINIDSVSGMARTEDKTPRGIRVSNKYEKIKIGSQTMVIKGLDKSNLPF